MPSIETEFEVICDYCEADLEVEEKRGRSNVFKIKPCANCVKDINDEHDKESEKLKAQIEKLETKNEQLQNEIDRLKEKIPQ